MQQLTWESIAAVVVFDIDGVIRDVGGSYRRALADTVEQFTGGAYRPSATDIDELKAEGQWNNDWEASRELIYRYFEQQGQSREAVGLDYEAVVAFFQSRYRGTDPHNWTGYICQEPLLLQPTYLKSLTQAGMLWGFFSGATRGSASYVLQKRLGLTAPVLIAMEDAPGKPDPTGLVETVRLLESHPALQPMPEAMSEAIAPPPPVIYIGDTVADMHTVQNVRPLQPSRQWHAVGVLPPHAQAPADYAHSYTHTLKAAGADLVLTNVEQLTPQQIQQLISP
ncbi:MAG TPA: TIGR01548 family HAD-type hydrolase [Chroococcidiopsis sp.]